MISLIIQETVSIQMSQSYTLHVYMNVIIGYKAAPFWNECEYCIHYPLVK